VSFSVTVLGSGSAVPTSRRALTSQFVECRSRYILIDCGEGTQMQMRKFGIKFQRIEHVLISHLHGDHYFGLVGLLSTMHLMGRTKAISIYGPQGLKEIVEMQLNYEGARLAFEINFFNVPANESGLLFEDAKISIEHFPLKHRIPTSGFLIREKEKDRHLNSERAARDGVKIEYFHRLKKGEDVYDEEGNLIKANDYTTPADKSKAYAFCSDTKYEEAVAPFIMGVDLLYHEATFLEEHKDRAKATLHSTAKEAASIAKMASAGKLLMGHLSARYDSVEKHIEEAQTVFSNCEVAEDGNTYVV